MLRKLFPFLSSLLAVALLIGCAGSETSRSAFSSPSRSGTQYSAPLAPAPVVQPIVATGGPVASVAPPIYAESAIMIDAADGEVLFQKNADQLRAVASTQKLLTAMVLLDSGGLEQVVTIAPSDTWVEPAKLGVQAGQRYTRRELLRVLLIKSCNDAAAALARDNAGSIEAFAAKMNRKAYELGAQSSRFLNPHGLTEPGQHSTARDMARIAFAAYRYPFIRETVRQPYVTFTFNSGRSVTLESTNKLLKRTSAVTGMKTGYTAASGRCLVTSANVGGRTVILVQLGSKTKFIFDDAARMVSWSGGMSQFARR